MLKNDRLPGMGRTLLIGDDMEIFSPTLPGVEPVSSILEEDSPQTVLIGEKDRSRGREVLGDCISRKIPFIVLGRGWSRDVPASLRSLAKKTGSKIIGPGSGGLITPFLSGNDRGKTALLAEGKGLFLRTARESEIRSIPLRYGFSFGERSDLSPVEAAWSILELDEKVRFFAFILERLRKGRELLEFAAEAARQGKCVGLLEFDPVPGDDRVKDSALRQFGVVSLQEPSHIVDGAAAFLTADAEGLRGIFIEAGQGEMARLVRNEAVRRGIPLLDADDGTSIVLKVVRNDEHSSAGRTSANSVQDGERPCLLASSLSFPSAEFLAGAAKAGNPFIPGIGRCLDAVAFTISAGGTRPPAHAEKAAPSGCPIHPWPTEYDAKVLLGAFGIPVARERLCRSFREAAEAAEAIGYPVALKVMSPNILHKTEARVVALNIQDREELRNAYGRTLEKARVADPRARIRGVLVQEMIRGGTEWRLEFRRDPRFGPVVETGISGVYTEILPDGVIRMAPFDEEEALKMIRESKGYPLLLEGWRRERLDIEAFASALSAFSRLAFCEREVARLDVNPLFVNRKGVLVVDAFIEKKGRKR
ncbi:MAG: hypothetical protein PWP47_385 [Synergistaceae bacterium]|jgi:hypothetical protein|nr:hypothetical protein [Synergistaceae bacterium]